MIAPGFTGGTLDRADRVRHDPDLYASVEADHAARLLVMDGVDPVVRDSHLSWTTLREAPHGHVFLGFDGDLPRFAPLLPPGTRSPAGRSPGLMDALDTLTPPEAALYAAARSLIDWHARHGFCAFCGSATTMFRAGWARQCPTCGTEHFPRIDPVVIVLAEQDDRVLLGRQPSWPPGRYSALAGFLEVGESIEEAVRREVMEEAGVPLGVVRYIASQPWPFPSSLMIACIGEAQDDAITLDANELEDARWFTRDQVKGALADSPDAAFGAPPAYAIAHTLLVAWAEG